MESQEDFDPIKKALEERGFAKAEDMTDSVILDDFGNVDIVDPEVLDAATEAAIRPEMES